MLRRITEIGRRSRKTRPSVGSHTNIRPRTRPLLERSGWERGGRNRKRARPALLEVLSGDCQAPLSTSSGVLWRLTGLTGRASWITTRTIACVQRYISSLNTAAQALCTFQKHHQRHVHSLECVGRVYNTWVNGERVILTPCLDILVPDNSTHVQTTILVGR